MGVDCIVVDCEFYVVGVEFVVDWVVGVVVDYFEIVVLCGYFVVCDVGYYWCEFV